MSVSSLAWRRVGVVGRFIASFDWRISPGLVGLAADSTRYAVFASFLAAWPTLFRSALGVAASCVCAVLSILLPSQTTTTGMAPAPPARSWFALRRPGSRTARWLIVVLLYPCPTVGQVAPSASTACWRLPCLLILFLCISQSGAVAGHLVGRRAMLRPSTAASFFY
jgi:hypothetical protein